MKDSFQIKEITTDIYLVTEPYFTGYANLFLIKGSSFDLLVDCGIGLFDIKKFLKSAGFPSVKVAVTHGHFDHIGGLTHFSGDEVFVTNEIAVNVRKRELGGLEFLKPEYFQPEFADVFGRGQLAEFCASFSPKFPPLGPYDQTEISVGNFQFEIIRVPGHTDDSIVLYEKKKKMLMSGDTLYDGEVYAGFSNSSKKDFKSSLQRISALDFELVLPGHNSMLNKRQALGVINRWTGQLK